MCGVGTLDVPAPLPASEPYHRGHFMITNKSKIDSAESLDETSTVAPRNSSGRVVSVGTRAVGRTDVLVISEKDLQPIFDEIEKNSRDRFALRKLRATHRDQNPDFESAPNVSLTPRHKPKPKRLLTLNDVLARVPVTRQTINNWERDNDFPRRIALPDQEVSFWLESEIDNWLDGKTAKRLLVQ